MTSALYGATYHVAVTGNDAGDGTERAPFASLKRATEVAAKAGDAGEIVLHAGVYAGDTVIAASAPGAANAPAWTIRAATAANGGYEDVFIDGGRRITEAQAVDAQRGIYFLPFSLANYEPSMWEAENRIRYIFVADRRAVEAFPASLAPGSCVVNGEMKEGVFFRTSDGKPPAAHDLGLARDRFGLVIRRPNVTVKGLRFRNFQLHFGVGGISVEAANVTVDSCQAWNCYGLAGVSEGIPGARILDCTARDVATGVKSYGKNTVVENCRFFRIDDAFVVQENEQDQCGIQFYSSNTQTARGNLCVGFQAGIFIKASGGVLILENNTVVASAKGGDRGIGPNTWRPGSLCRGNVVVGFDEPISLGAGLNREVVVTGNLIWRIADAKGLTDTVEKIKAGAGGDNVVAPPRFMDERKGDYRLAPPSAGATPGGDRQAIGALGAAPVSEADKTPPTAEIKILPPAQPLGLRAQVYFRKNTWIGGKAAELTEEHFLNPDHLVWTVPSGVVDVQVRAEDTFGKVSRIRHRVGAGEWSVPEPFRTGTLKINLPKDAPATDLAVQVSDNAGNWSEPVVARVTAALRVPKLMSAPAITTSERGAIIAFKTDVPCAATLEWGANGKLDQRTEDPFDLHFRFDNSLGMEWTEYISGPRTDHCLAITAPVKAGETYSFRLKLNQGPDHSSLAHEGQFTLRGAERTLHVATTGADTENGGAQDHPFATLQYAVDRALPGDRVVVAPGIYAGSVSVTHGGVAGHPLRIESAKPWGAVLDGRRAEDTAIRLNNVARVEIAGFEMRWYNNTGVLAYQAQDILVEGCKFWDRHWVKGRPSTADGVVAFNCKRIALHRNLFFALNSAFRIYETDGYRITRNTAARCFHRVASVVYSDGGFLRNNSFAFGSSYLLSLVLTEDQVASLDSDYNNFAVQLRADALANARQLNIPVPPEELLTRDDGFYFGESKGLSDLSRHNKDYSHGVGISMPTLAAWRATTGQDKHSISAHPRYADPQNRDFRLLPNSPNIGKGENGVDIGAFGVLTEGGILSRERHKLQAYGAVQELFCRRRDEGRTP